MEVTRLFDLLDHYKISFKFKDDALAGKDQDQWLKYSIDDYIDAAKNISFGLLQLGVKKGDKIATISNNCPEWNFLDMAILQVGAIHVPVYPTISEADYNYILNHAEVKYVFVSGKDLYRKIEHLIPDIPTLLEVYSIKPIENIMPLSELIELGRAHPASDKLAFLKESIGEHDVATLVYTSGTTGPPKGVMLSHYNVLSNVMDVKDLFPIDETCTALSYLPLCHVYERTDMYTFQYLGLSIYYAESMGTIVDNIREVRPHIFTTVPRLLEKVLDRILAKGHQLKGYRKAIFFWAVELGPHGRQPGICQMEGGPGRQDQGNRLGSCFPSAKTR